MKKILVALIMGLLVMNVQAEKPELDQEKIKLQLQSMGTLADQNAFEYLGRIFSDEVLVDYTSAFGGEPATVPRVELMKSWAGLLPGFDLTRHNLSNMKVMVEGNSATATADITANHYLIDPETGENGFWQISGQYNYELEKGAEGWTIKSLTLIAGPEKGSRDVLGKAGELAQQRLARKESQKISLK
ncbi:nuclear transport factor 2 family protein [Bacterioplanoides sp.]|uniref:nuclear transport factor 2 family protein n=1 Tax=Bacterioplanoides sp. TaxID=2066072 RepID=UPI003B0024BC